jgi:hypothetical protein
MHSTTILMHFLPFYYLEKYKPHGESVLGIQSMFYFLCKLLPPKFFALINI